VTMPTLTSADFASIGNLGNLLIPAYDRLVEFQLRETPTFRSIVDRRPVNVTNPGETISITWYEDLDPSIDPLQETVTPSPITVDDPSRTSVTIREYGAWLPKTVRLQKFAFTAPDQEIAELLARHQGDSVDQLVRNVLDTGTNTLGAGATTTFTAALTRQIRNKMRSKNVPFRDGSSYVAHVHPDVTFDLMSETGQAVWGSVSEYNGGAAIYAGEIGKLSAVRFVENTRCKVTAPTSTVNGIYNTYVVGKGALVEANAAEFSTVIGPQTDPLKRFFSVGWWGMAGWALHRPESLLVVKTTSSLAPKTS
jgi:N4-gp56 family major capsid protein